MRIPEECTPNGGDFPPTDILCIVSRLTLQQASVRWFPAYCIQHLT